MRFLVIGRYRDPIQFTATTPEWDRDFICYKRIDVIKFEEALCLSTEFWILLVSVVVIKVQGYEPTAFFDTRGMSSLSLELLFCY